MGYSCARGGRLRNPLHIRSCTSSGPAWFKDASLVIRAEAGHGELSSRGVSLRSSHCPYRLCEPRVDTVARLGVAVDAGDGPATCHATCQDDRQTVTTVAYPRPGRHCACALLHDREWSTRPEHARQKGQADGNAGIRRAAATGPTISHSIACVLGDSTPAVTSVFCAILGLLAGVRSISIISCTQATEEEVKEAW